MGEGGIGKVRVLGRGRGVWTGHCHGEYVYSDLGDYIYLFNYDLFCPLTRLAQNLFEGCREEREREQTLGWS